ncbi:MAG TPA: lipid-A-disaccharide synthase N-terminal domain-containing protein [Verrucomicrobiae bacterium]|nr:lipid-A-disaccharide synthase N-terminal domain-containing protein [Verrucomicrobiae bacterium]
MDWLTNLICPNGHFLGHQWTPREIVWNIIGWSGNAIFSSRFYIQWYVTEKKRQVVIPQAFWWISLIGSLLMLSFAVFYDKHFVVIFAYAFAWIPYTRNLIIHFRHKRAHTDCAGCGRKIPPQSNFCPNCGVKAG